MSVRFRIILVWRQMNCYSRDVADGWPRWFLCGSPSRTGQPLHLLRCHRRIVIPKETGSLMRSGADTADLVSLDDSKQVWQSWVESIT